MAVELIIGIVFSLAGLLLVALGVFFWTRTRNFVSKAKEVKGVITQMVYSSDSEGSGYAPVFQFTTLEGQVVEIAESVYSNPPQFSINQVIDVLYDPQSPNHARVKKWSSLYFVPLLLGGMGIVFGGIGVVLLIFQVIKLFT